MIEWGEFEYEDNKNGDQNGATRLPPAPTVSPQPYYQYQYYEAPATITINAAPVSDL